jgi:hypothetical protein
MLPILPLRDQGAAFGGAGPATPPSAPQTGKLITSYRELSEFG